ncbi:hypothetical protein [Achromobacter sp. 2789STDY5608633]|uniref:hypothetical protein n=1 Tax=Achromobacter sp. 2789STDY5608633 TaxID=1806501 RepID=UPI0009EBC56F|nr:hypothetical protein [Achromobacter sp. 2789STDY5608633]
MIQSLLGELWPYLVGGVAIVVAYFGVRLKGKSDGRQELQNQINQQAVDSAKEARDVQTKINRLPDGDAAAKLRRDWMRHESPGRE